MEKKQVKKAAPKAEVAALSEKKQPATKAIKKATVVVKADLADNIVSKTPAVKTKAKAEKNSQPAGVIYIKQIASKHGRVRRQAASLTGLGLSKINQVVQREDTPAVRGMINKVKHLVEIIKI